MTSQMENSTSDRNAKNTAQDHPQAMQDIHEI